MRDLGTIDAPGKRTTAPRRSNRRTQILRTTARLFLENGFDATSMGEIADVNQISKPGLYYHFKSKQDLLAAIMHYAMDLTDRAREKIIAQCTSHEERLRRMVHEHATGITKADDATITVLSIDAHNALLPEDRREINRRQRVHFDFVRETLEGLKAEGKLCDVDTTVATFNLLGMIWWTAKWYRPGRLTAKVIANEVTKLVMRSVLRQE